MFLGVDHLLSMGFFFVCSQLHMFGLFAIVGIIQFAIL